MSLATSPQEAIAKSRRQLTKIGIPVSGSVFDPPEGIHPAVWRSIGPICLISQTLVEHGFIELNPDREFSDRLNPAYWRFKTHQLPVQTRRVIRTVYEDMRREYFDGGAAWLGSGYRWFMSEVGDAAIQARCHGNTEAWLPVLSWLIESRNRLARIVDGTALNGNGPARLGPVPRLGAYVFALDQALHRIADGARQELIRRYLEGKFDEDQKKEVVAALQAHVDAGLWADPERDIAEVEARWLAKAAAS